MYSIADAPCVPLLSPTAVPPDTGTLYDCKYDVSDECWVPWSTLAAYAPPIPADARFGSILVPTADTTAVTFFLNTAIEGRWANIALHLHMETLHRSTFASPELGLSCPRHSTHR